VLARTCLINPTYGSRCLATKTRIDLNMKKFTVMAMAVVMGFASASMVQAHEEDKTSPPAVQYRKNLMQNAGFHMHSLADIAQGKNPNKANMAHHAEAIAINARLSVAATKEKNLGGKTTASPEIWNKWSDYEAGLHKMAENADKLAAVLKAGDMAAVKPAMQALGGTCKSCHKAFRVK
jgi:cytochrome c556